MSSGCPKSYDYTLPHSGTLGNAVNGKYQIVRSIIHAHSPYSWDACDSQGIVNGSPNRECLKSLKFSLCLNQIDYLFLTDHPNAMTEYEFPQLLLQEDQDQLSSFRGGGGMAINSIATCLALYPDFRPMIFVGFESGPGLMALAMTGHLADRTTYDDNTAALALQLQTTARAIVVIPHTESRTLSLIQSINPDGIEIYNVHAVLDPKIRHSSLNLPPFKTIPSVLTYLADPYRQENPDFAFMHFVQTPEPIYFQIWNQLIASGRKVAGFGGSDAHQNVFSQTGADGERLDSFRKMLRFMTHYIFVVDRSNPDQVKASVKAGQSWLIFEGLGSPVGMDFFATVGTNSIGSGESMSLSGRTATVTVQAPQLHSKSPQGGKAFSIRMLLKQVNATHADGSDTVVASSSGESINYQASSPGAYRVEIFITPQHLSTHLKSFQKLSKNEYPWIITNHLYLDP